MISLDSLCMSYDNSCKITYMNSESQDAVEKIERALIAMRMSQGRGGPRRGREAHGETESDARVGPPWASGHRPPRGEGTPPWADVTRGPWARGEHGHRPGGGDRVGGAARFRLLDALIAAEAADQRVGISEVAVAIGVDQPRASRLINEAVDRGLVTRTADEKDARRSVVRISEAGRAMLDSARTHRRSAVTDAMAAFTPEEQATFADLLSRFVAAWHR